MIVEIYLLEQLDALARKGTLSAASEELHLTQPTLTRSMQKLEQQIGVPLFVREHKKIRLNDNGRMAADYAARIIALEEEMRRRIHLQEMSRNTLSFGSVSPGPIKEIVPQLSDMLFGKALQTEIAEETTLLEGLHDGRYRLIALNHPVDEAAVYCQKIFSERIYYCFLPVEHPVAMDGIFFKDINGRDILMPSDVGFWKDIIASEMPDSTIIEQEGNERINIVAEHSNLPVFSSDIAIKHHLVRPSRISIPILDDSAKADYYCLCKASDKQSVQIIKSLIREK